MRATTSSAPAFSLAEVVLALGLCSIALLSILGLLGASMKTSRAAGDETALASMAQQIITDLSSVPFDSLGEADPRSAANPPLTLPDTLTDSVYYFNDQGVHIGRTDAAVTYEGRVRKRVELETRSVDSGPYNRVLLELHFTWPVVTHTNPEKRPNSHRLHASIARY